MSTLGVVVLSGGLDSATALGVAVKDLKYNNVRAISFDYGQRHSIELQAARDLASHYAVEHTVVTIPSLLFVGGSLTSSEEVQDMRYDDLPSGVMSPTYVPYRNGNLLSMSVAYADSTIRETYRFFGSAALSDERMWDDALIYAGMHSEDAAGFAYADCTPEFLGAQAAAIHIGTYGRVRLHALFQYLTKDQIISWGMGLGVPYNITHSCYRGTRPACGLCSTCQARKEAFRKAGYLDPIKYEVSSGR